MKEERKLKSKWNYSIYNRESELRLQYVLIKILFTFVHRVDDSKEIQKDSPLLMQFETKQQTDYLNLKRSFGVLIKSFSVNITDKRKVENQLVEAAKEKLVVDVSWYNPSFTYVAPPVQSYKPGNGASKGEISGYKNVVMLNLLLFWKFLDPWMNSY